MEEYDLLELDYKKEQDLRSKVQKGFEQKREIDLQEQGLHHHENTTGTRNLGRGVF